MTDQDLQRLLDARVQAYTGSDFIANDPISIPHQFSRLQDIEIAGFWTAMLSWGQRKTIINKSTELMERMDWAPYDFIRNHEETDRKAFLDFKHRTFQPLDTLYFLDFLQYFYQNNASLEEAFVRHMPTDSEHIGPALAGFHKEFFSLDTAPARTRKHVSDPRKKATCKRLNMFLRWMVRGKEPGVDFGLWKRIRPAQLLIPLDLHVDRVARKLGLVKRKQTDWKTVLELTGRLRAFDPEDPVKYDYALFGMGVLEKTKKYGYPG